MGIKQSQDKKKTDTSRFLVRGIGLETDKLEMYGYLNAYLDDKNHDPHYEDSIYLLFQPKDLALLERFFREQRARTHLLIEEYDYPEGYTVGVYKFPAEYMREYRLFKVGRYSQFSDKYVSLFPMIVKETSQRGIPIEIPSFYDHVFHKTESMREFWEQRLDTTLDKDSENWSIPNLEKETLDIYKFYNKQ